MMLRPHGRILHWTIKLTISTTSHAKPTHIPYSYTKNHSSNPNAYKFEYSSNWHIPNQQTLEYEQRCLSDINVTVELIRQTTFEKVQLRTPYFQEAQSLQNQVNEYGQPGVQSHNPTNQRPYIRGAKHQSHKSEPLHESVAKYINLTWTFKHQ